MLAALPIIVGVWSMAVMLWQQFEYYYYYALNLYILYGVFFNLEFVYRYCFIMCCLLGMKW